MAFWSTPFYRFLLGPFKLVMPHSHARQGHSRQAISLSVCRSRMDTHTLARTHIKVAQHKLESTRLVTIMTPDSIHFKLINLEWPSTAAADFLLLTIVSTHYHVIALQHPVPFFQTISGSKSQKPGQIMKAFINFSEISNMGHFQVAVYESNVKMMKKLRNQHGGHECWKYV